MNRLQKTMTQIATKRRGEPPLLMTHVVLGYPSIKESIDLVCAMADGGAAMIELQIPFSDPMADGPTIMAANEAALESGVRVKDCFNAAAKLRAKVEVPLLFMSYFNIVYCYHGSVAGFCKSASSAGIEGLIVPDVPPEENGEGYWTLSREHKLLPIPIVAPTSTAERMSALKQSSGKGFVYCVSTTGTTGARSKLDGGIQSYLGRVKKYFDQPVAVGFGISSPAQVRALDGAADIAIVGSAMIDCVNKAPKSSRATAVRNFTRKLSLR